VKVLLDTNTLIWAAMMPERLGAVIETLANGECIISAVSVWELAIKQGLGKIRLGAPAGAFVTRAAAEFNATTLSITTAHAAQVEHLPPHHRDPFDRLLVAQAQLESATLVTADRALAAYGDMVQVIG